MDKKYELHHLVTKYRMMSESQVAFAYKWRDEGRVVLDTCYECGNTGIVETMNGEDDFDRDICEFCDNFEVIETIEWFREVGNMFKFLNIRREKNGIL